MMTLKYLYNFLRVSPSPDKSVQEARDTSDKQCREKVIAERGK